MSKNKQLKENDLKNIPGVGVNMEQHFFNIGVFTIDDLIGADPEELFCGIVRSRDSRMTGVFYMFFDWLYITQTMTSTSPKN